VVCAPPTSTELSPFSSPFLWPPWPGSPERRTATPVKKGSSASERDGAVLGLGDGVGGGSPEHTGHRSVEGGWLLAGGCRRGVFNFGDAQFYGSLPAVGVQPTSVRFRIVVGTQGIEPKNSRLGRSDHRLRLGRKALAVGFAR
jgi:hypothetical protein